jgi:hypothetical protein
MLAGRHDVGAVTAIGRLGPEMLALTSIITLDGS